MKVARMQPITALARIYIGNLWNENRGQSFQPRGRPRIMLDSHRVHELQDDSRFEDPDLGQRAAWLRSVYRYFRVARRINIEAQDRGWAHSRRPR